MGDVSQSKQATERTLMK